MQNNEMKIFQIKTDRHVQIKSQKYKREYHKDINHQFDMSHVCKNVRKKKADSIG